MTMKELELRDQKFALLDKVEAITGKAEKRGLTENERTMVEKLLAEAEAFNAPIQEERIRADKQNLELDRQFGHVRDADGNIIQKRTANRTPSVADPLETRSYSELCERCGVDSNSLNGWESDEEFWTAFLSKRHDPRLYDARAAGMNTLDFQSGGAIVPAKIAGRILDLALESEVVRPRAKVYPLNRGEGRTLSVPLWNVYDRSSGEISGTLKMQMAAEEGQLSATKGKLEHVAYDLKKGYVYVPISNEILEDAPRFLGDLESAMATAIAFGRDDLFLNGVGAAQPKGALQGANVISIAAETGQAAATILAENIAKMQSRMLPSSLVNGSAVWLAHPSVYPQLRLLTLAVGTGGSALPMLQGSARQGWTLNGIELVFSEKCAVLGTVNDLSLVDFSKYGIVERPELVVSVSEHILFDYDQTAIRVVARFDGKPLDPTATTPKNGDTFSSTVTLATRA